MSIDTDKGRLSQVNISQKMQCNMKPEHIFRQLYFQKNQIAAGYAGFSDMIGIADFGTTDASVNHDEVIYELQSKL